MAASVLAMHVHEPRQPRAPVLHGLVDPSYFRDFQRRLREELEQLKAAINDSEVSIKILEYDCVQLA